VREIRRRFHEELRALQGDVQRTGTKAQLLLERALQALARGDLAVCDAVIRGDDQVDQLYLDVERRILGLFALQTPVASDLRLLTALLHINLHLEHIADQAVNIAKITKLADGLPPSLKVLQRLEEMGAGTVALSRKTPAKPSEVEAHLTGRPPRRTRTTRSWLWPAKFERRSGGSQTG
jgi:phosphate transport system protein